MMKADKMASRYAFEIGIGLWTFLAVLAAGEAAFGFFALLAPLAFIKKGDLDERERQLFHKANTITLGAVYISMFPVYYFMPKFNWLIALACSFVFFHGLVGLIVYRFGTVDAGR
jgi:hypothetical protein